jgi:flagellar assembly protein FliH
MNRWSPPSFDGEPISTELNHNLNQDPARLISEALAVLPTVNEVDAIRGKAYQDAYARGLQEGLTEGHAQGAAKGREEGIEQGRTEGFQLGYQQGYQSGIKDIEHMSKEMQRVMAELQSLPQAFQTALPEWVYETALRLAGKEQMDRSVFVAAVQEALMRLPRPGENLIVGVPPAELEAWQSLLSHPEMPFQSLVRPDADLSKGFAYVLVDGTRLDVGISARDALVRSALGLLPQHASDSV